jgi:hypothetical protein
VNVLLKGATVRKNKTKGIRDTLIVILMLQGAIGGAKGPEFFLKSVHEEENIVVDAKDRLECIGLATEVFKGYIDRNFLRLGLNVPSKATKPTRALMFEIKKDARFVDIFTRKTYWEQNQVVEFCRSHRTKLMGDYHSTLFPIKVGEKVFIVCVTVGEDGLLVARLCLPDFKGLWKGGFHHIVVFPET